MREPFGPQVVCTSRDAYQVMTLSAIGDAETPAGGSVCIRYDDNLLAASLTEVPMVGVEGQKRFEIHGSRRHIEAPYFEITHEASARRRGHFCKLK